MKRMKPHYIFLIVSLVFWCVIACTHPVSPITGIMLKSPAAPTPDIAIALPYQAPENPAYRLATYAVTFNYSAGKSLKWSFFPDNCIRSMLINGKQMQFDPASASRLCDLAAGVNIDLANYAHPGQNTLLVTVENLGGPYGLNIVAQGGLIENPLALYCAFTMLCIFCYALRRRPELMLLSGAALMVLFSAYLREIIQQPYDTAQHMENILYYAQNHMFPPPNHHWESGQPPLYYTLAGLLYNATGFFTQTPTYRWECVRALNFVLFECFLLYGVLLILRTIRSRFLSFVGIAALLFWPANMVHVGRISNDILLNLSFVAASYHFLRGYKRYDVAQLCYAIMWVAVALATKSSSLALITALSLNTLATHAPALRHITPRQILARLKPFRMVLLLVLIGLSLGYGRNLYNVLHYENISIIAGKEDRSSLFVPSEFAYFDYWAFITEPYVRFGVPESRNELYWNFFPRTVSFGEFQWQGTLQAVALNCALMAMFLYLCILTFTRAIIQQRPLGQSRYFLILTGCMMFALAFVKVHFYGHPFADARHLFSVIPFFLLSYLHTLALWRHLNRRIYSLGVVLLLIYLSASLVHYYLQLMPA
jgi:hypothetical protein